MLKWFFWFFYLTLPFLAYSQSSIEKKANAFYSTGRLAKAAELYEKILLTGRGTESALIHLAECKSKLGAEEEVREIFDWWIKENGLSKGIIKEYATLLKNNGEYAAATDQLVRYLSSHPEDTSLNHLLATIQSAERISALPESYAVILAPNLNSPFSDFAPVLFKEDIVFCSNREGMVIKNKSQRDEHPFSDLFISKKVSDSAWTDAFPFSSSINTAIHEGPAAFNKNFDTVYFSRNGESKKNAHLKLYSSALSENKWGEPTNFMLNDSTCSFAHPCISDDGKLFFFISDMPGGKGGADIYVCIKIDSNWSFPINLGPTINTSGNELFPQYTSEGNLYFSSDGHPGLGGLDILVAGQKHGEWMMPVNLGRPINSSADDFSFYPLHKVSLSGMFSSNRKGGLGGDDIYFAKKR